MTQKQSNLTQGSIKSHIIKLAIPSAMGMIFDTLYNLTDNWYAGMISDQALVGLSIAGIVFILLIAVTIGLQSGTSAMVAPEFANNNMKKVQRWIGNCLGIGLLMSVIVLVLAFLFTDELMNIISDDEQAKTEAWQYLSVIVLGNVTYAINGVCAGAFIAMGNTVIYRNVLIAGFFGNLVLNPILTFQLGLGIKGLAFATLIIKISSALYLFHALKKHSNTYHWPRFNMGHWAACLKQILPSSFNFLTVIIGAFVIMIFIGRFGSEAVAGYSVALRLEQVLLLPVLGLSSAVMAIVGQNFGVGAIDRIRETFTTALKIGFVVSLFFVPIMIFAGPLMMGFFTDNQHIIAIGTQYLRADAVAFYAYVVLFASVSTLQAIKQPNFPLVIGILRQLILPVSVNYLLIVRYNHPIHSLFWSIVAIVIFSAAILYIYTKNQLTKL